MSSLTLTLTGNSSELCANYHPPIELDRGGEYVCGLIDFHSYMSIPNVSKRNNKFYYAEELRCRFPLKGEKKSLFEVVTTQISKKFTISHENLYNALAELNEVPKMAKINVPSESNYITAWHDVKAGSTQIVFEYYKCIEIPVGCYELEDLIKYVNNTLVTTVDRGFHVEIGINKKTLKCDLKSTRKILFNSKMNSIGTLLGFKDAVIEPDTLYTAEGVIKITSTNVIKLETNITTGAYSNDKLARTLHEFYPSVDIGYKIIEVPRHVIYMPVAVRTIQSFVVRIVDQEGNLIDFRGENITLRVHIKRI